MTDIERVESVKDVLTGMFQEAIDKAFPEEEEKPIISPCEPRFGDYQCVNAMGIFKKLKGKEGAPRNPRAVATLIEEQLERKDVILETRAAKARFDEDEDFKKRAQVAVTKLQSGEEAYLSAWHRICDASRKEFQAIYDRLDVKLIERGESFYNPLLMPLVTELKDKGIIVESDGANCIFIEGQRIPLIVQKSDGGFGYGATDLAAIRHRLTEEKADWIIYVTDVGQSQHFDLIFGSARKIGWLLTHPSAPRIDHVGFGLVMGEDGQKFRSRSGDVVRLVELLDEAKHRCATTIRSRREERDSDVVINEAELDASASAMGYGAVKYADLKNNRLSNYKFSFDEMLSLKGNTAVYLMYAYARICGILRNAGCDAGQLVEVEKLEMRHEKEVALGLQIARFPEAIERAMQELMPNRICEYLYDLSEIFNGFYTDCQVIGSEAQGSRLLLCLATATVKKQCFHLLGITPLERI